MVRRIVEVAELQDTASSQREPLMGSRSRDPDGPGAESYLALGRTKEARNLPFLRILQTVH